MNSWSVSLNPHCPNIIAAMEHLRRSRTEPTIAVTSTANGLQVQMEVKASLVTSPRGNRCSDSNPADPALKGTTFRRNARHHRLQRRMRCNVRHLRRIPSVRPSPGSTLPMRKIAMPKRPNPNRSRSGPNVTLSDPVEHTCSGQVFGSVAFRMPSQSDAVSYP